MNVLKHLLLYLTLLSATAASAVVTDLPVKTIGGKQYYYYEVKAKDSLYSLQQKLGIDREVITRYNPSVVDGLQEFQTLYFPVDARYDIITSKETVTHKVGKGETLYGIAHQYDTTVDALIELNPSAKDGIKTGQVLVIKEPAGRESAPTLPSEGTATTPSGKVSGTYYIIKEGETLYAIAKAHGVEVDDIIAANPDLSPTFYKGGQRIIIPEPGTSDRMRIRSGDELLTNTNPEPEPVATGREGAPPLQEEKTDSVAVAPTHKPAGVSFAVILPFMLSETTASKKANQYTEFYKGLLLAVDTMKMAGRPIRIYAYDSAGSADTVKMILRSPELLDVQAIIAPPDEAQLALVAAFGEENDIMVVNPFVIRDESYRTNPNMLQANVPSDVLQAKAVTAVISSYGNRTPVLLRRSDGPQSKKEFVESLKEAYLDADANPIIITYTGSLTAANLARLKSVSGDFIFIPYESKQEEVDKIMPTLVEFRESLDDPSRVMLLGYPEWITFRGDSRKNMLALNSVIYSRFYDNVESWEQQLANNQFRYWYGSPTEIAAPRMGFLGLDLGMFLIQALRTNGGDFDMAIPEFNGVQNGFDFVRPDGAEGYVNDMIYLVNYRPSGIADREDY